MITDEETNFLYLSPLLKEWYPKFYSEFESKLVEHGIEFGFLDHTKDIWCRDYMPVQLEVSKYARFRFEPKYLLGQEKYKSDSIKIMHGMSWGKMTISVISLDGGNLVNSKNRAFCTTRIFEDNPDFKQEYIQEEIRRALEIDHLIVIPEQPEDFTGHCDGMIRFVNDSTVLINNNSEEDDQEFVASFEAIIRNEGLQAIEVPTSMYRNENAKDASGCYLNYLQIGTTIFVPFFNRKEDEEVRELFHEVFPNYEIVPVVSNEIAKKGGVLNCIGWNIKV